MSNTLQVSLVPATGFQKGLPEELTLLIIKAEDGYECVIKKNSQAYLYVTTVELENGHRVDRTRYTSITADELEDVIIDDIKGYQGLYIIGNIIEAEAKAVVYNCHIRRKMSI